MSERERILREAIEIVTKDRAADHGEAENTFGLIARLWSVYLNQEVEPVQVAVLMVLLKVARQCGNPAHRDNYTDMIGYSSLAAELELDA